MKTAAKILLDGRCRLKLTQSDLAKRSGVSPAMVCNLETGKRNMSVETARKLAKVLAVHWTIFFEPDAPN